MHDQYKGVVLYCIVVNVIVRVCSCTTCARCTTKRQIWWSTSSPRVEFTSRAPTPTCTASRTSSRTRRGQCVSAYELSVSKVWITKSRYLFTVSPWIIQAAISFWNRFLARAATSMGTYKKGDPLASPARVQRAMTSLSLTSNKPKIDEVDNKLAVER